MMCLALGLGLPFLKSQISSALPIPALNLDFTKGYLDDRITFSRASGATYTDTQGNIAFSSINLVLRSEEFENSYWDKNAGLVSVLDKQTTAPDGSQTASLLTEVAGTGSHHLHNATGGFTPVIGTKYCMSVYLKQPATNADRYIQLTFWNAGFGLNAYTNYDLQTKVATSNGSSINTSGVEVLDNGWMRVWSVATATATGASGFQVAFVSSGTATRAESYTVTAGSEESVYIYGAMMAASAVLTPYANTTSAVTGAPRFDNAIKTAYNLLNYSEQFDNAVWFKNGTTVLVDQTASPSGVSNADKLTASATSNFLRYFTSQSTSTSYTYSVYVKKGTQKFIRLTTNATTVYEAAGFNIDTGGITSQTSNITPSIKTIGNGWYRCSVTYTTAATITNNLVDIRISSDGVGDTATVGDDVYIWGTQLEKASTASTYLATPMAYTNMIRNSTMVGAVAGTPGTLPTNWNITQPSGISQSVIGVGSSNGISYVDLRFNGTASSGGQVFISPEANSNVVAASGQTWVSSEYVALVGGSVTSSGILNPRLDVTGRDASGGIIENTGQTQYVPVAALTRVACAYTLTNTSSVRVATAFRVDITSGTTVDFTLRIGAPQLQLGSTATTYIPTKGVTASETEAKGLLIEEARTNLCLHSADFSNAAWIKTNAIIAADSVQSPDGGINADTITASSASATVKQGVVTTAVPMTFSIYLKRKTGTGNVDITLDGSTWVTQSINSNDWTRCIVTQTGVAGTSNAGVRLVTSADAVYAWGAQVE